METSASPGTISDVLARLILWCRRSDHGFIRITFDDGTARDKVIRQLREELKSEIAFHELELPPAATPEILAERLADELARLGPGVISITGFEASLPPTGPGMVAALRALNARRETFIHSGQNTLWWFPRHITQAMAQEHHDLNSWFLKRTYLTETIATPEDREIADRWHEASRLKKEADFAQAESIVRAILSLQETRFGPAHPNVATALNNLGQLLHHTSRLAEAEPLMRRALSIAESCYGPEHPIVAKTLNNLAMLLQDTNRPVLAETLIRRALQIDETVFGPDHPEVATTLNNLAILLQITNRLTEAEPLIRRALRIDESTYGPQHPSVATDLNNLATLLNATNRSPEALPLMLRALEIDEAVFGPDHPEVARDLNNLSSLLRASNRLPEAEDVMWRALRIDEKYYGPHHDKIAIDLNNIAQLLKSANRFAEAEPLMRRALQIDEAVYGTNHPKIAMRLNNLALLLCATDRLSEAEPLMRRAIWISFKSQVTTGHKNPATQVRLTNYLLLARKMNTADQEVHTRLDDLRQEVGVEKAAFDTMWQELLVANPP